MKRIVYSPDYKEKFQKLKKYLDGHFGEKVRKEKLQEIRSCVRELKSHEELGYSVKEMYGVDTEYRCIFVAHNYIFYKLDEECIYIVNMYNEREDFMRNLFGINTTSQETEEYWNE